MTSIPAIMAIVTLMMMMMMMTMAMPRVQHNILQVQLQWCVSESE